ncbi:HD-GYP domain-containing protein [Parvibium lacunae]|uniref:HD domain-containing protein n=1 Tax=Parvibium lacunae TaxID=1888893 RepID=A0A368L7E7_9BURK|nr:HD domain-containing phosphohydrolase [Parvibium lacunae]RCS59618.1 HD domain-containing protein [Parvibium lacunae]
MSTSFADLLSKQQVAMHPGLNLEMELATGKTHYTQRLSDASQHTEVIAQEDIYSDRGLKLISAGSRLTPELRERLLLHKLHKPLEKTVQIGTPAVVDRLISAAEQILAERTELLPLIGWRHGSVTSIDLISQIRPNRHTLSALALIEQSAGFGLLHSALVTLIALGIGKKLNLSFNEMQQLCQAAVFHDLGQLYVNPTLFHGGKKLAPAQFRHIAVHPLVGSQIMQNVLGLPEPICRAVRESHERIDGSGYPQRLTEPHISKLGKILSFAEQISGVAAKTQGSLSRLIIAAKVIPYEHSRDVLSAFIQPLADNNAQPIQVTHSISDHLHGFFVRIANTLTVLAHLENRHGLTPEYSFILDKSKSRFDTVQKAFSSTGLDMAANNQNWLTDMENSLHGIEAQVALDELLWRLSELARDVHLRCDGLSDNQMQLFEPLIGALDGTMTHSLEVGLNQEIDLF